MNNDNTELIRIKREQIALLEQEIKMLRTPRSLLEIISTVPLAYSPSKGIYETKTLFRWGAIRDICTEVFRYKYYPRGIGTPNTAMLSEEDKEIAAQMASEIIAVWNKYVEHLYGEEEI